MKKTADQLLAGAAAPDIVIIRTRSGGIVRLPRKEIGRDSEKKPIMITDFSSVNACPRCNTEPRHDGSLPSAGGILRIYAIHRGIWTAYAGACDCVFGAFRTIERRTNEGPIPGMRYVDELPGVPPGLTTDEWTLLNLYKKPGDGYVHAAARIPESIHGAGQILRLIEAWEEKQRAMPAEAAEPKEPSIDRSSPSSAQRELIGVM